MFKRYRDFADVPADQHPGQPAYCGEDCDVWRDRRGMHFLITASGERVEFASVAEAVAQAAKAKKIPQPEELSRSQTENFPKATVATSPTDE